MPSVPTPEAFAPSSTRTQSGYTSSPSRNLPPTTSSQKFRSLKKQKKKNKRRRENVFLTTSRSVALEDGNMELGLFKRRRRVCLPVSLLSAASCFPEVLTHNGADRRRRVAPPLAGSAAPSQPVGDDGLALAVVVCCTCRVSDPLNFKNGSGKQKKK